MCRKITRTANRSEFTFHRRQLSTIDLPLSKKNLLDQIYQLGGHEPKGNTRNPSQLKKAYSRKHPFGWITCEAKLDEPKRNVTAEMESKEKDEIRTLSKLMHRGARVPEECYPCTGAPTTFRD